MARNKIALVGAGMIGGTLAERLAPVSPRALSLTLKAALAEALVTRALQDSFPPVAVYALTGRGVRLVEAATGR